MEFVVGADDLGKTGRTVAKVTGVYHEITAFCLCVRLQGLQIGHRAAKKDLRIIMKIGKQQKFHKRILYFNSI